MRPVTDLKNVQTRPLLNKFMRIEQLVMTSSSTENFQFKIAISNSKIMFVVETKAFGYAHIMMT